MFSKSYFIPPFVLNYCFLDTTCFTYAEDNFIWVTSLHEGRLTVQLNQCQEKNVSISTVRRRLCEAGQYGRIVVKKPLFRKQNNIKMLQWAKANKDWATEQWNKVLWTDKSKFEIYQSNRTVYEQWRVGERAATFCITPTIKHGGGSAMVWGAFANYKAILGEGQIESDWLSQPTAASHDPLWNATCGSSIYIHVR